MKKSFSYTFGPVLSSLGIPLLFLPEHSFHVYFTHWFKYVYSTDHLESICSNIFIWNVLVWLYPNHTNCTKLVAFASKVFLRPKGMQNKVAVNTAHAQLVNRKTLDPLTSIQNK